VTVETSVQDFTGAVAGCELSSGVGVVFTTVTRSTLPSPDGAVLTTGGGGVRYSVEPVGAGCAGAALLHPANIVRIATVAPRHVRIGTGPLRNRVRITDTPTLC